MAKADEYRRAIEHAILHAELSASDEIKRFWLNIREPYEGLLVLDASIKGDIRFSNVAGNG